MDEQVLIQDYRLCKLIEQTDYIYIYEAEKLSSKEMVILKLDKISRINSTVRNEAFIQNQLLSVSGINQVLEFGISTDNRFFLSMEQFSQSLGSVIDQFQFLSIKTVMMIGIELLTIVEQIHNKHILLRNINDSVIYVQPVIQIIDLSHAIRMDQQQNQFVGSKLFASRNYHLQKQLTISDDLEQIGYLLYYLRYGKLPWGKDVKTLQCFTDDLLYQMKEQFVAENLPLHFSLYFKNLSKVNYNYLKSLFQKHLLEMNEKLDYKYDWMQLQTTSIQNSDQTQVFYSLLKHDSGSSQAINQQLSTIKEVNSQQEISYQQLKQNLMRKESNDNIVEVFNDLRSTTNQISEKQVTMGCSFDEENQSVFQKIQNLQKLEFKLIEKLKFN